jgi:hypothetical protein
MKSRKNGNRYPLLLYRRVMSRLWLSTLILGLLLLVIWGWGWFYTTPLLEDGENIWLAVAGLVSLAFALFALFGRSIAYVQPNRDHMRLVTPFLRMNISYRRLRNSHPAVFTQLFPPNEASWAQRSLLSPFYGKTAVVVELTDYPMNPRLMRFFLAPQMFSPRSKGLVILVPDWMLFSTELDSFRGSWIQSQKSAPRLTTSPRKT